VVRYGEFAQGGLGIEPPPPKPDPATLREAILAEVRAALAAAPEPLRPAFVAQQVIRKLGRGVPDSDWAGAGSFSALLDGAEGLAQRRDASGGWLWDPRRHAAPGAEPPETSDIRLARMAALVKWLLAQLGNIPVLSPARLGFVCDALAERLPLPDPSANELRQAISEAARAAGHEVGTGAVNAVMHRVGLAGFDWTAPPGEDAPRRLRLALLENIRHQLAKHRLSLTDGEAALLLEWAGLAAAPEAAAVAPEPEPEPAFPPPAPEPEPAEAWPALAEAAPEPAPEWPAPPER